MRLVNRAVRPVAPHLFTPDERAAMADMVDLLLAHGLTLSLGTEKPPHMQQQQQHVPQPDLPETNPLSPPVHTLVLFKVRPALLLEGS